MAAADPIEWVPTPEQVKARIPSRFDGGPFSPSTRPTRTEVQGMAEDVAAEVLAYVGGTMPVELMADARRVATLGTAADVEQGLYPEQQESTTSPAQILYTRYKESRDVLRDSVRAAIVGLASSGAAMTVRTPSATVVDAPLVP